MQSKHPNKLREDIRGLVYMEYLGIGFLVAVAAIGGWTAFGGEIMSTLSSMNSEVANLTSGGGDVFDDAFSAGGTFDDSAQISSDGDLSGGGDSAGNDFAAGDETRTVFGASSGSGSGGSINVFCLLGLRAEQRFPQCLLIPTSGKAPLDLAS